VPDLLAAAHVILTAREQGDRVPVASGHAIAERPR
jgi:hypothetical protein